MAAEDRRCCGDPFTVAPRLERRSQTSASRLELVERRDQARSRGKAVLGSQFGPRGRPLHALQPLRTLVHTAVHQIWPFSRTSEQTMLFEHQNGASRPRARRDEFSRFQAWLKPCLGSLEQGTGLQCLWTLWQARIQRLNRNEQMNTEQRFGYASDTRSRTLIRRRLALAATTIAIAIAATAYATLSLAAAVATFAFAFAFAAAAQPAQYASAALAALATVEGRGASQIRSRLIETVR